MEVVLPTLAIVAMIVLGGLVWVSVRRGSVRRQREALVAELDGLARAAPGGTPERALEVSSPRVIEARAANTPCHRCGREEIDVAPHDARTVGGERLRVVATTCKACGARRELWFRLAPGDEDAPAPH